MNNILPALGTAAVLALLGMRHEAAESGSFKVVRIPSEFTGATLKNVAAQAKAQADWQQQHPQQDFGGTLGPRLSLEPPDADSVERACRLLNPDWFLPLAERTCGPLRSERAYDRDRGLSAIRGSAAWHHP
jgi:hypothetical protein